MLEIHQVHGNANREQDPRHALWRFMYWFVTTGKVNVFRKLIATSLFTSHQEEDSPRGSGAVNMSVGQGKVFCQAQLFLLASMLGFYQLIGPPASESLQHAHCFGTCQLWVVSCALCLEERELPFRRREVGQRESRR